MTVGSPLLLDVNVLLALSWPTHQFHRLATDRLQAEPTRRWATCALTQLGFVRLSSNPAVMGSRVRPREAVALLRELTADPYHLYLDVLPELATLATPFDRIVGHQQVTDAYLLCVARSSGAILATFDQRLLAIDEAGANIEVIS